MTAHHAEPTSIKAEQQLLGATLLNPDIIPRIARQGGASLFFDPVHQRIFEVAERKAKASELAAPVTMHVAIAGDAGLGSLGGEIPRPPGRQLDQCVCSGRLYCHAG
jgi:replicative DNA helicase